MLRTARGDTPEPGRRKHSSSDAYNMRERILAASAGRDRVVDAVKALALALVVLGHNLAWTLQPDHSAVNTLEQIPTLTPLTWILQILPLFFLLAGTGLVRHAQACSANGVLKRLDRLISPTIPLLLLTVTLSVILTTVAGTSIGQYAGILPMQLTWFLGVYLMIVAVSPLLARMRTWWHYAAMLAVIGGVDAARVNISEQIGWVNLLLVWAYFASLGMHLPQLRTLPRARVAVAGLASATAAVIAVIVGPYSAALITTTASPGLSNLAPPTIVLALAGSTQICLLLLAWPALQRWLSNDRVWIPVIAFSTRAMGIYLWHMLIVSLCVAAVMKTNLTPRASSGAWWLLHATVFSIVVITVWLLAPNMLRLADKLTYATSKIIPTRIATSMTRLPVPLVSLLAGCVGMVIMIASESGLSDPLTSRAVLGLPYAPWWALTLIIAACSIARKAAIVNSPPDTRHTV